MAILADCEIWYPFLDPARPNARYNKANPTWEVQLRTKDKAQKDEWAHLGLKPKAVREEEDGPVLYWQVRIKKKKLKADGTEGTAPEVKDGDLELVDPTTIGNGSIADVRIFQYDYKDQESGQNGKASVLMGIQLTKHIVYKPIPRDTNDEFSKKTTVRIEQSPEQEAEQAEQKTVEKTLPDMGTTKDIDGEVF